MSRVDIATKSSDKGHCRQVRITSGSDVDNFHVEVDELRAATREGSGALLAFVYDHSIGHILRDAADRGLPVYLDGERLEAGILKVALLETAGMCM